MPKTPKQEPLTAADHAEVANTLLNRTGHGETVAEATLLVAGAHAHATLALAAEMRTSNLIAVYTAAHADAFNMLPEEASRVFYPMYGEILERIRKELKLT